MRREAPLDILHLAAHRRNVPVTFTLALMKAVGVPLQYACFRCRKCFKRPQFSGATSRFMTSEQQSAQWKEGGDFEASRTYKCPDCGSPAHYMGVDFKAPRKTDVRAWQDAEAFIASGKLFIRET